MKFKIAEKDIVIKFYHENNTNNIDLERLRSSREIVDKTSFTECIIQYDSKEYKGKAQLHKVDNFSKSEGRFRSLKRTLKQGINQDLSMISFLNKEERGILWNEYFKLCKIK